MNHYDSELELDRLGDDLRAGITIDLARGQMATDADPVQPRRAAILRRPRILAGGTLGVAGVGTALVLALSAGGAAAPPAFAITTHADGSLTVNLDAPGEGITLTNTRLARMGADEHIQFTMGKGPASSAGAVPCVAPQGTTVAGPRISLTVGPGVSNTETIAAGNTGEGDSSKGAVWHVASCQRFNGGEIMRWVPTANGARFVEHPVGADLMRVSERQAVAP